MHMEIQDSDVAFFEENGYLHLQGVIRGNELDAARAVADQFLAMADAPRAEWHEDFKYGDLVGDAVGESRTLCRVEYPFGKSQVLLALVAHPTILELAYRLYGEAGIVTWEDMIIKVPGHGVAVPFHQDLLYQSTKSTVFSIGVYLDDSVDNPLIVLPRTQRHGKLSEDEIAAVVERERSAARIVVARAGDLIVHNVLMVHGSEINYSERPRRVIYFEFRTPRQLQHDSPWGERWIRERARYVPAAINARRALYAAEADSPFARRWLERFGSEPDHLGSACVDLRMHHDDVEPAVAATQVEDQREASQV